MSAFEPGCLNLFWKWALGSVTSKLRKKMRNATPYANQKMGSL